jgi:phenylalanyl-tRNA synthetase beta chain
MNIKILDSWLRDYLKTKATAREIAEKMSLTSVSIERVEPYKNDFVYDIEVTTNRPDLASVVGLAREAAAILPQFGLSAEFTPPKLERPKSPQTTVPLKIKNDETLVNRICAVVMEVTVKPSPEKIKMRLETSDIRSLNNLIDITNYVMRTIGHPTHVFDYDRIAGHTINVQTSRKGQTIETLDNKRHVLAGGDIVATDSVGKIIDLLGIMGLENSVVTDQTKRIVFFIDNNEPTHMRKTSMTLGIRTEAVQLNEKGIDPELAKEALLYGVQLYQEYADATLLSDMIDIYPHPAKEQKLTITQQKITQVMGIELPFKESARILERLGFGVTTNGEILTVTVPTQRADDITIPEDLVEEIARVYGYHNLPSELAQLPFQEKMHLETDQFYWEARAKQALKYWGYTEVYSYPMVSEQMYEGPVENAVTLQNPLGEEFSHMRRTLVPNLLRVVAENRQYESMKLFEIANVYEKQRNKLPKQTLMLAGLVRKPKANFFEVKGLIEQLAEDFGIRNLTFRAQSQPGLEAEILLGGKILGTIEVLDEKTINFELNFEQLVGHATLMKTYIPLSKYPPIIEDLAFVINEDIPTGDILTLINKQSPLIRETSLLDRYQNARTFHIVYQDATKNLTTNDVSTIREKVVHAVSQTFHASLKT